MQNNLQHINFVYPNNLEPYSSEIKYVLMIISERLGISFRINDNSEEGVRVSYGAQVGQVIIHQEFFTQYSRIDNSGIHLSKMEEVLSNEIKKKDYEGITFYPLFSCDDNPINKENGRARINFDLIGSIFFQISRIEERDSVKLDKHGRFDFKYSLAFINGFLNRPEVEYQILLFGTILKDLGINLKPNRKIEVFLTHDVDRLRSYHSKRELFRESLGHLLRRRTNIRGFFKNILANLLSNEPKRSFEFLMGRSESLQLKSIFLFMADARAPQDADYFFKFPKDLAKAISMVKDKGHLIGIHPGYDTYKDGKLIIQQKEKLENLVQHEINYSRQHVLRWTPYVVDLLDEANIKIDFTLSYPEGVTFRAGTTHRFPAYSLRQRKVLDLSLIPTPIMEFALFMDKYIRLSEDDALKEVSKCLDQFKLFGGDLVILFHTVKVIDLSSQYDKVLHLVQNKLLRGDE